MKSPIFFITGPPAAGKTTLCSELLRRFDFGVHIPVDDVRTWVVSGRHEAVPWTDETERQFQIAEGVACEVVRRYHHAGFAVAVDHCRNMSRLEELIQSELSDLPVVRICLMPRLDVNLHRSHTRTNKNFNAHILDDVIKYTNENYRQDVPAGWKVIDNSALSVEESVRLIYDF